MTATEWVFRHAGGCLIETPDPQPVRFPIGMPWPWVATVWPDRMAPDGWGVLEWDRTDRGWWLPATIAIGDVIEFGVVWPESGDATQASRWYGWLQRCTVHALVVIGGYDHPAHAADAARPTIDELRLAQLAAIDDLSPVGSHNLE
ncbi:hypothetical protein [Ilumatobacter nonamiensis]|uniref:hypothetical protein n=1 Tax=Ilumatobacter nonamiensis TaxID=467093 RepID=UPI0003471D68|nr:hypothetical protein [Ilumatobacter nonamiensis]